MVVISIDISLKILTLDIRLELDHNCPPKSHASHEIHLGVLLPRISSPEPKVRSCFRYHPTQLLVSSKLIKAIAS